MPGPVQTKFPANLPLSDLTSTTGLSITGATSGDYGGNALDNAGDINGDGVPDLIIGAANANSGAGESYVVFGNATRSAGASLSLASLNGSNGFKIPGLTAGDSSGAAVAGVGDIDNDGYDDIAVGAPGFSSFKGRVYVVRGGSNIGSSGSFPLSSLNGSNGFIITGEVAGDRFGTSLKAAGDINADGIKDMIIGAPGANSSPGATYLILGKMGLGSTGSISIPLTNTTGVKLTGSTSELSGASVGGDVDLNNDGIKDMLIGAPGASSSAGAAYVVFGRSNITAVTPLALSSLNSTNSLKITGVSASYSGLVSRAGDVNNDGIDDIIIGAPSASSFSGAVYLVFGKPNIGSFSPLSLSSLSGKGVVIPGATVNNFFGLSVAAVGDFNGDGIDDVAAGAPDVGGDRAYVIFGNSALSSTSNLPVSTLNGLNGFRVSSVSAYDQTGYVAGVGDINGDGLADLLVGAPSANSGAGGSYLVFGDENCILNNNAFTVTKGNTISLSASNFNATYLTHTTKNLNIHFTFNAIRGGYFAFKSKPFDPITDCLQSDISNGLVQFTHDNSPFAPSCTVQIGGNERLATMLPQTIPVTFVHQGAALINNQLSISQGQVTTLFSTQLSATNLDTPDESSSLRFIMSNIQRGYFQQSGNPGTPLLTFTQAQVQTGTIQFVHDGSTFAPTYNVTVSDGSLSTVSSACTINFNLSPLLVNNNLSLNQGRSVIITSSMLSATDPDGIAADLTFIISNVQRGQFELLSASGNAVTSFTQAQVQAGEIQFVSDGTAYAPSYKVAVSDGKTTTTSVSSTISFNGAPVITKNALTINQGETVILQSTNLNALDPDDVAANIVFTPSNVMNGQFELVSLPGLSLLNFTLAQVQNNAIQFVHDGSINAPSYSMAVSDGKMDITAAQSTITFDANPVLVTNTLSLSQGQTLLLGPSTLAATHPTKSSASLIFNMSNVQNGYFQRTTNPGQAITLFTQGEVQNSLIEFISDGSATAPSYKVTASDGTITTAAQSSTVNFNIAPVLVNNNLIVNQGKPVILNSSNLSATDLDNPASSLIFYVNNVQYGHFEKLTGSGVFIASFTQAEVQAGQIKFIPDGSSNTPSYSVTVSDGRATTAPVLSTVSFNGAPVITNNALTINQGETVVLKSVNLNALDPDDDAINVVFTPSNVMNGQFELVSLPSFSLLNFTLAQVQNNTIQFVHDGSINAPSYSMAVSDGKMDIAAVQSAITFDANPVLVTNTLSLSQGQTLLLGPSTLAATHPTKSSASLIFNMSSVQNGYFQRTTNPGQAITLFTQGEVQNSLIQFISDGSTTAPSYKVTVSDGIITTVAQSSTVNFNIAPVLVNNNLNVKQGESIILSSSNLSATDADDAASTLIFYVSNVQYGHFEALTTKGLAITSFSQAQVQAGQIQFISDNSNNAPTYSVAVTDGKVTGSVQFATITFNIKPILVNNALTVRQGQRVILSNTYLSATQGGSSVGSLTFNVSNVAGGYFGLTSAADAPITSFTQLQVQSGAVQFTQDGSATVPSYSVAVSDGIVSTPAVISTITFNAKPTIVKNHLNINQGQALILSPDDLAAEDRETNIRDLVFTVNNMAHSHFEDINSAGIAINRFEQSRIISGSIKIKSDDAFTPIYNLSVSDGELQSDFSNAIVNFSPSVAGSSSQADNSVTKTAISVGASLASGMILFLLKRFIKQRSISTFEGRLENRAQGFVGEQRQIYNNFINLVARRTIREVNTSNILGSRTKEEMDEYIKFFEAIVGSVITHPNLQEMRLTAEGQVKIVNYIVDGIKEFFEPEHEKRCCCSKKVCSGQTCLPYISPKMMKEKMDEIIKLINEKIERSEVARASVKKVKDGERKGGAEDVELASIAIPSPSHSGHGAPSDLSSPLSDGSPSSAKPLLLSGKYGRQDDSASSGVDLSRSDRKEEGHAAAIPSIA
jgi:hypothetical protein